MTRRTHVVRQDEKLSEIAALHGVDVAAIVAANPQRPRVTLESGVQVFRSLASGEELRLPGSLGAVGDVLPDPKASCPDNATYSVMDGLCHLPCTDIADCASKPPFNPICPPEDIWDPTSRTCMTKVPIPVGMANPASVNCGVQGGFLKLFTVGADGAYTIGDKTFYAHPGDQASACIFSDGSACGEWDLYRHECAMGGYKATCEKDPTKAWDPRATDAKGNLGACVDRNQLSVPTSPIVEKAASLLPWVLGGTLLVVGGVLVVVSTRKPTP